MDASLTQTPLQPHISQYHLTLLVMPASHCICSWVQGDATALPFGNAEFDAATMGYGLRNVNDRPKALAELHRVLKPGAP